MNGQDERGRQDELGGQPPFQFSLATILYITTLIAVVLAQYRGRGSSLWQIVFVSPIFLAAWLYAGRDRLAQLALPTLLLGWLVTYLFLNDRLIWVGDFIGGPRASTIRDSIVGVSRSATLLPLLLTIPTLWRAQRRVGLFSSRSGKWLMLGLIIVAIDAPLLVFVEWYFAEPLCNGWYEHGWQ